MIYKSIVVIWISGADEWTDGIEGILRGPGGPKKVIM